MSHYCEKCNKTMADNQFYTSKNKDQFPPDGKLPICKACLTMHIDNWNPDTYMHILKDIDVPYIKEEWDKILAKAIDEGKKITGLTVLGKYLSKMKLSQWMQYSFADTELLEEKALMEATNTMKAQGMTSDEIEERLKVDKTPLKPRITADDNLIPSFVEPEKEEDDFSINLTEEDKLMLTMKWGRGYRWEEKVRMEQLYQDMMASYDIQGAGHKDTLIMICKASLKANQLIDAGDIEGFQKMQKAYDSLMKSGRFTAAQNKAEGTEYVDSIGEIVAICEKEGFIPRYYTDGPQDKVDETLVDLKRYTYTLVTEEMNLGNMIEASLRQIEQDRQKESIIDTDDGEELEDIMNYDAPVLTADDYLEYDDLLEEEYEEEEE